MYKMTGNSPPSDRVRNDKLSSSSRQRVGNVFHLLAQREISPRTKHLPKRQWGQISKQNPSSTRTKSDAPRDARHSLRSWVEIESLQHLAAKYCSLVPPPKSTIAIAFSSDGTKLASTHGDHTVKVIDWQTGRCLKVLSGHRRTPWVVRFHPLHSEILASGSLDHEVRIWDSNTSKCIAIHEFHRPIASIAFHASGEFLAVASGHKLYIWYYKRKGEDSSPIDVLRSRRTLRAVHFHPHAGPFLLTSEANDIESSDSSVTQATSLGYLQYPPPSVYFANPHNSHNLAEELHPMFVQTVPSESSLYTNENLRRGPQRSNRAAGSSREETQVSIPIQLHAGTNIDQSNYMETSTYPVMEGPQLDYAPDEFHSGAHDVTMDHSVSAEVQSQTTSLPTNPVFQSFGGAYSRLYAQALALGQLPQYLPPREPLYWELPFLQGWLMSHGQTGLNPIFPSHGINREQSLNFGHISSASASNSSDQSVEVPAVTSLVADNLNNSGRSGVRHRFSQSHLIPITRLGDLSASVNIARDAVDGQPIISRIQSELAASLTAASAEVPGTVKLRVWSHDVRNPGALIGAEKCCLTIPHAVLCSEMGAHFSPCGRFLAVCVACMLPHLEAEPGLQTQLHQNISGAATSPTRHPISAHQVMYELRVYSLEQPTFGSVLVSRAIRAAHCLTSIQFSPTSEHILLAYGRRHGSLLKSIVIDGETTLPIYTILEIYRVRDMELVSILPSAEDEVNVACFHPLPGRGLVYGTKEGKLRILHYDGVHLNSAGRSFPERNMR